MVVVLTQNWFQILFKLRVVFGHFHAWSHQNCFGRILNKIKVLFEQVELVSDCLAFLISNGPAKLRDYVSTNFDHRFMQWLCLESVKHLECCVFLQCLVWILLSKSGNDLGYSKPQVFIDIVSSVLNQFDYHINIPIKVLCKLLGKNCDFKYNFFFELVIVLLEIIKDLVDNLCWHLRVTKTEQRV